MELQKVPDGQIINFQMERKLGSKIVSFRDVWGIKISDTCIGIQVIANVNKGLVTRVNDSFDDPFEVSFPETFRVGMIGQNKVVHLCPEQEEERNTLPNG